MSTWSSKEDEILINFVRRHEMLYDTKNVNYRRKHLKMDLWREIGELLHRTDTNCYKRWCSVRDYYIRQRAKNFNRNNGEAWKKRAKLLTFLDKYSYIQRRCNGCDINNSVDVDNSRDNNQDNNELYMIHVTEDTGDPLSDKGENTIDTNVDEDINNFKWKHSNDQEYKVVTKSTDSNNSDEDSKNVEEYNETRRIKRKRKCRQAEESFNHILKSTRDSENDWDETDLFFRSMAKIVKKLPRYQQIELRMRIGALIGNAELQCIDRYPSGRGSPQPSTSGTDHPEITTVKQRI